MYLQENGLARIILEQNASEVKTLTVGESWNMGEGYTLTANSIDAKASGRQAWFTLSNKTNKLMDKVLGPGKDYLSDTGTYAGGIMSYLLNNDGVPVFITYLNMVYPTMRMDAADMKYTWLRSQNTTEIKPGGIFGIMEVTSIDNGRIELRNRAPIELAPGATINLMGNLNFKVGSSNTSLSFHPYRVRKP